MSKYTFEEVLKHFEYWLESNQYTTETGKCYVNCYTKNIVKKILCPWFEKHNLLITYDNFNQSAKNEEIRSLIESLSECIIEYELKNPNHNLAKKTLINYRSGLRAFFTFLETECLYFDCKLNKKSLRKHIKDLGGSFCYIQKQIIEVFFSRLITQDRVYENMIYPARVLNQIFNNSEKKSCYKALLRDKIMETKFLISDNSESSVSLENISKVTIKPIENNVYIYHKGKSYELFTEKPSKGNNTYEKLNAQCFGDLSLDHDKKTQSNKCC